VCDLVPGFLSIFPNFHAHDVPRESHEVIPCGHFVGFWFFLSMCWCGVGHFVRRLLEHASWSCFILSLTLEISAKSPCLHPVFGPPFTP
jgi:hypothetical protein